MLTLGSATVSGLKATATASYTDSSNAVRTAVVVADIIGEVQLVLDGSSDSDSCPFAPDSGTVLRRSNFDAEFDSTAKSKRSYQVLDSPSNQKLINRAASDVLKILTAAHNRLSSEGTDNKDIGQVLSCFCNSYFSSEAF